MDRKPIKKTLIDAELHARMQALLEHNGKDQENFVEEAVKEKVAREKEKQDLVFEEIPRFNVLDTAQKPIQR